MSFDASSLTSSNLTQTEFERDLLEKLQDILNETFKDNMQKRQIKHTRVGLNFACPFCRDSATDNHKKRGHLILSGKGAGFFKCFNCGETMPITKFFSSFDEPLNLSDVSYITKNVMTEANTGSLCNNLTAEALNSSTAYEWAVDREVIKTALNLQEISRTMTPIAWNYLIGRCQYRQHERFLYCAQYNQLLILNLIKDRVMGIQFRDLNKKQYLTMNIEKLRKMFLRDETPVPEAVSRLSCVFNIFSVDFSNRFKPVLMTEGPFDAFLLPNCCALAGANKSLDIDYPFWYIYDNDVTGSKHSIDVLKKGKKTFMWKKFKSDYGIPDINPYITNGDKHKWDVTDVMKYMRDMKIEKKVMWSPYFTNSILDGLNI